MEVTVEKTESCTAKIAFTVAPEEYEAEVQRLLKHLGRQTQMKGFRPGKVPPAVVERTHGKQAREEAKHQFLQRVFAKAVEEHELKPLSNPHVHFEQDILAGQGFEGDFEVDLKPELALGEYKGLRVETTLDSVTDEEVEAAIEQACKSNARPEPAGDDGLPEDGMALCKIELLFEDEVVFTREGMRVGPGVPPPGVEPEAFKQQLTGVVDGAEIELPVTFPPDFEKEEARGQQGACRVTVNQAFRIVTPTREELIEQMDAVEDEASLLQTARESLERARAEEEARRQESELLDKVIEAHDIDLPEKMVAGQVESRLDSLRSELTAQGTPEDKLEEELSTQEPAVRAAAAKGAKAYFLVEAIAEKEGLQVTEDEIRGELQTIAERNQASIEEVAKYYQEQNLFPQLALEVVERKVRGFLREAAVLPGTAGDA